MHCPWFILVLVNYTSSLCRSFSDGDGLKGVSRPLHVRYISTVTNDDIYLCGSRYSSFASMAIAIGLYATASELITNLLLLIHTLYSSKMPIGVRAYFYHDAEIFTDELLGRYIVFQPSFLPAHFADFELSERGKAAILPSLADKTASGTWTFTISSFVLIYVTSSMLLRKPPAHFCNFYCH
jgi:hypothetical protein